MRLAGTCSRYSKNATPQLATAATYHGEAAKFLRWPYHAAVMKPFDAARSSTVCTEKGMDESGPAIRGLSAACRSVDGLVTCTVRQRAGPKPMSPSPKPGPPPASRNGRRMEDLYASAPPRVTRVRGDAGSVTVWKEFLGPDR